MTIGVATPSVTTGSMFSESVSVASSVVGDDDVRTPNGVQNQQETTFSVAGDSTRMTFYFYCKCVFLMGTPHFVSLNFVRH